MSFYEKAIQLKQRKLYLKISPSGPIEMFKNITLIAASKRYLDFVNNFLFWFSESTMLQLLFSGPQLLSYCFRTIRSKFRYLYAFCGPCEATATNKR